MLKFRCNEENKVAGFAFEFNENHGLSSLYDGTNVLSNSQWNIIFSNREAQAFVSSNNYIGAANWLDLITFTNSVAFNNTTQEASRFNEDNAYQGDCILISDTVLKLPENVAQHSQSDAYRVGDIDNNGVVGQINDIAKLTSHSYNNSWSESGLPNWVGYVDGNGAPRQLNDILKSVAYNNDSTSITLSSPSSLSPYPPYDGPPLAHTPEPSPN